MERRTMLGTIGASALTALGGCISSIVGASSGTLATRVSDRPGDIEDFESCVVTVTEVHVMPAGDDAELEKIDVEDGDVDLTEVKGDKSQLVNEADLDTGDYDWLRVKIDGDVDATLADGGDTEVMVPSNGLKLNKAFEIREDETTTFTADFTPVERGNTASYNIQPVTKEVTVTYEDEATTTTNESETSTNSTETTSA